MAVAFESWLTFEPSPPPDELWLEEPDAESEEDQESSFISFLQKQFAITIEATKEMGLKGTLPHQPYSYLSSSSVYIHHYTCNPFNQALTQPSKSPTKVTMLLPLQPLPASTWFQLQCIL